MIKNFVVLVILAGVSVASAESAVSASGPDRPGTSIEELTATLLGESGAAGDELAAVAAQRGQRLARLIETDPGEVLRLAVPADLRAALPSQIRDLVEERVELEGALQVLYEDGYETSRLLHFLETDSGERYSLHFASPPPDLLSDTRVKVRGLRLAKAVAIESGAMDLERSSDRQALMSVYGNPFGAQKTAVFLVNFASNPIQPYTPAAARNVVFTTTSNFDLENSYGQTWLTGDVFGWYTISYDPAVCDYSTVASKALAAATAAGVNLSGYAHYVFAFPGMSCSWWGLGSVGGNPSYAWINGSLQLRVVAHEMGHNFGLYHSHSWDCGSVVLGPSCTESEYGDVLDTMGGSAYHFNAFQKERLGWLAYGSSPPIKTVTASGTYSIEPMESTGSAAKALKIPRGTTGSYFYVEQRRGLGLDSGLSGNVNVSNGVVVHWATPSSADSSELLDMTPATSSWSDPALTAGLTYTDPVSGVSIAANSAGATGASVTVTLSGPPPPTCTHVSPTVSVVPSGTTSVSAGTAVSYNVSVTNKDVSPCTASTFNLGSSPLSGWTVSFGPASFAIAPGATASTTLQVKSLNTAASATYTINGTVTNASAASASTPFSATYTVSGSGGGGGAGTLSDNFDRADSTNLGTAWAEVSGDLVISGKMLKNTPQVGSHVAVASALTGATQTVEADFTSPDNNQGPRFGLVLRYRDPKNYYLIYRQVGGSSRLLISSIVNGVEKILANASIANPAKNVPFHLKARVSGTTLSLDFNGVNKVNVTEPTSTFSTGKVGIQLGSSSKTTQYQADNFSATVQ